jgi:predicted transcriptional regulator of viral defense system
MRYIQFREKMRNHAIFSLSDVNLIDPNFDHRRLNEWQHQGYIRKLRRGYYLFADTTVDEKTLFLAANKLYAPSYVSLEMALSIYGLIPESVYTVTSVSSRKTATFETPIAQFSYRCVKPSLMFGYRLESSRGQNFRIADLEKAVLDYLYLNPHIVRPDDFAEWRFNSRIFLERADLGKLRRYAEAFGNRLFLSNCERLLTLINEAD